MIGLLRWAGHRNWWIFLLNTWLVKRWPNLREELGGQNAVR